MKSHINIQLISCLKIDLIDPVCFLILFFSLPPCSLFMVNRPYLWLMTCRNSCNTDLDSAKIYCVYLEFCILLLTSSSRLKFKGFLNSIKFVNIYLCSIANLNLSFCATNVKNFRDSKILILEILLLFM
jgi:hypothetical protein